MAKAADLSYTLRNKDTWPALWQPWAKKRYAEREHCCTTNTVWLRPKINTVIRDLPSLTWQIPATLLDSGSSSLSFLCALNISFQSLSLFLWSFCVIFIFLFLCPQRAYTLSLSFFVLASKRFNNSTPPSNQWWQCRPKHLFSQEHWSSWTDSWNVHVASFKKKKSSLFFSVFLLFCRITVSGTVPWGWLSHSFSD